MGVGIYLVWPAFYTDVTDAYRLPRRDHLRVDLGGMVKNLSPVIRSGGYHILADATGAPDLFAHIGPTIRALLPWRRRDPSSLTGRARILVTVWVLVVVGAAEPHARRGALAAAAPHERMGERPRGRRRHAARGHHRGARGVLAPRRAPASRARQRARDPAHRAHGLEKGTGVERGAALRRTALTVCAAGATCGAAWALWPVGQYQPVGPTARGTITSAASLISSPPPSSPSSMPALQPVSVHLAPGRHLAIAMIPVGGATKRHPALFVIEGDHGRPAVVILSNSAPAPAPSTAGVTPWSPATTTAPVTTTMDTTTSSTTTTTGQSPPPATQEVAFPFELPAKQPGPGDTQAVAVGRTSGGVVYDVAYSVVTVTKGANVTNTNGAYALASCNGCTTVAVSFQVVLVVGRSAHRPDQPGRGTELRLPGVHDHRSRGPARTSR